MLALLAACYPQSCSRRRRRRRRHINGVSFVGRATVVLRSTASSGPKSILNGLSGASAVFLEPSYMHVHTYVTILYHSPDDR